MQRLLDMNQHRIHWHWNPTSAVGNCTFTDLFNFKLPFLDIHSHKFSRKQYPIDLAPAIHVPTTDQFEIVNRQLKHHYTLVDWAPEVLLTPEEKGCFSSVFKLAPKLQYRFERYRDSLQLSECIGFQIRCREDKNAFIDRDSRDNQIRIVQPYLDYVNDKPFFFCTDSQFVEQHILEKRPDARYIKKSYEKVETSSQFVKRDRDGCLLAAIEFFCLMQCHPILKWHVGGWTQFGNYLNPDPVIIKIDPI